LSGCGKVGKALGKFLADAGYHGAGAARKPLSVKRRRPVENRPLQAKSPGNHTLRRCVLITTPDGVIADTAV